MPHYVYLNRFTDEGIRTVKSGPRRVEGENRLELGSHRTSHRIFKEFESDLVGFYMTMGHYDIVMIGESPNDEAATKIALTLSTGGLVSTQTLRAYTEAEFRDLVNAIP